MSNNLGNNVGKYIPMRFSSYYAAADIERLPPTTNNNANNVCRVHSGTTLAFKFTAIGHRYNPKSGIINLIDFVENFANDRDI